MIVLQIKQSVVSDIAIGHITASNFVTDGPYQSLTGDQGCCGAACQTGHSLRVQNQGILELTVSDFAAILFAFEICREISRYWEEWLANFR